MQIMEKDNHKTGLEPSIDDNIFTITLRKVKNDKQHNFLEIK